MRAPSVGAEAPPLRPSLDEDPGVRVVFTGRAHGNVSLVVGDDDAQGAREVLLALVGLPAGRGVFMEQVHGARVAVVGEEEAGRGVAEHRTALPGVDAMVTTATDLGLAVLVADCVPVVLSAPGEGVAVAHAGRAGVLSGVVGSTVAALAEVSGTAHQAIVALIGPAIGGCCYEVPVDLAREVTAVVPAARTQTRDGKPGLDLVAAVDTQLRAAGVGRVERVGSCTRCDPERWFSHRATTGAGAPAGRQAGVVVRGVVPPRLPDAASLDS